jgi:RNA polymerase sigma factor (sigma-70 family)
MATNQMSQFIQHVRRIMLDRDEAGLTDGQLLACFIESRDEAAFAALVKRHGPMIWGVCRRVVGNHHDAEDAFQATFLVLARKAASVVPRELVANWLYGVARQTALQARRTATRRRARERQVAEMSEPAATEDELWRYLQPLLDKELSRLPDKYRVVIVLCDLEGKTRIQAAAQLGLPEGTVGSRLARARAMLAKRLARHGLAVSGGALAAVLSQNTASAVAPTAVVSSTIKAASLFAAGQAATTGAISVKVAALAEGVLKTMLLMKLKTVMGLLIVAGIVGSGVGLIAYGTARGQQSENKKGDAVAPQPEGGKPKAQKDEDAIQGTWHVIAMEEGGKAQPKARFEDVKMRLVMKGDKLAIMTTTPDGRDVGQQGLTFTLDEKASPKRLDASKDGKTILGIYAFEKGQLKICIDLEGANRPASFKTAKGTQQRSYDLEQKDAATKDKKD